MGISRVKVLGLILKEGVIWSELSTEKKAELSGKVSKFAKSIKDVSMKVKVKIYFGILKSVPKKLKKMT